AQRDREKSVQTPVATRRSSDRRSAPTPLPAFMPVTLEAAASAETALEVVLLHGRVLRVRPGFDADELRRLLTVLEAPSCLASRWRDGFLSVRCRRTCARDSIRWRRWCKRTWIRMRCRATCSCFVRDAATASSSCGGTRMDLGFSTSAWRKE